MTDPSDRAVYGVGLRPLACWDCGFESRRGHGCLFLVSVVCCQVEVSTSGWSLVQRSPTECGVSECDREASIMRRPWPSRGCCAMGEAENGNWAYNSFLSFVYICVPCRDKIVVPRLPNARYFVIWRAEIWSCFEDLGSVVESVDRV
jgi:hypothetical protein